MVRPVSPGFRIMGAVGEVWGSYDSPPRKLLDFDDEKKSPELKGAGFPRDGRPGGFACVSASVDR